MNIPGIDQLDLEGKRVLVRGDLDVGIKQDKVSKRLEVLVMTVKLLIEKRAGQVVIIGHRGRPNGEKTEELSNRALIDFFSTRFESELDFVENVYDYYETEKSIRLVENLRFWKGEERNDPEFAQKLALFGDVYVNEAFAVSHRDHASLTGVPALLPSVAGVWFAQEVQNLSQVSEDPKRPLLFILSGVKKDKLNYLEYFESKEWVDKILVGGRLPEYLPDDFSGSKVIVARLNPNKEDITINSIEKFEEEIATAKTIVLAGVPGKYEDEGNRLGTERVFRAVANSGAFKVVGGGDSLVAISLFGLENDFNWVSVGGGAMLEFLAKDTLPGIEVLQKE